MFIIFKEHASENKQNYEQEILNVIFGNIEGTVRNWINIYLINESLKRLQ